MERQLLSDASQGEWVEIRSIVLQPSERAPQLPADTQGVPLEMRLRGFLLAAQANLGEMVRIRTRIGREVAGILNEVRPSYDHNFGQAQPELLSIGAEVRTLLKRGDKADGSN